MLSSKIWSLFFFIPFICRKLYLFQRVQIVITKKRPERQSWPEPQVKTQLDRYVQVCDRICTGWAYFCFLIFCQSLKAEFSSKGYFRSASSDQVTNTSVIHFFQSFVNWENFANSNKTKKQDVTLVVLSVLQPSTFVCQSVSQSVSVNKKILKLHLLSVNVFKGKVSMLLFWTTVT